MVILVRGAGPLVVIFAAALTLFLVYTLGNPPSRKEDITDRDRIESAHRALGVRGTPDADDLKPPEEEGEDRELL